MPLNQARAVAEVESIPYAHALQYTIWSLLRWVIAKYTSTGVLGSTGVWLPLRRKWDGDALLNPDDLAWLGGVPY